VTGQRADAFWDVICDYEGIIRAALSINLFLILLGLLAVPGVERGTASFVILVVDFVLLIPLFLVTLFLYWRCRTYVSEGRF